MEYANYIAHCIEIARRGEYYVAPNPMVGAVLARNSDETILAEGWHEQYGKAHAEVNCFKHFEEQITNHQSPITHLKDCTLFVNLEPCSHYGKTPPCAKLIIEKRSWARSSRDVRPEPVSVRKRSTNASRRRYRSHRWGARRSMPRTQ